MYKQTFVGLSAFNAMVDGFIQEGFNPNEAQRHAAFTFLQDGLIDAGVRSVRIVDVKVHAYNAEINWK
jgi:hypothetical protein